MSDNPTPIRRGVEEPHRSSRSRLSHTHVAGLARTQTEARGHRLDAGSAEHGQPSEGCETQRKDQH